MFWWQPSGKAPNNERTSLLQRKSASRASSSQDAQPSGSRSDPNSKNAKSSSSGITGWWSSQDLDLLNVGSVARDHLANERTFLAWLRTSLSISGLGITITQIFRLQNVSPQAVHRMSMAVEAANGAATNRHDSSWRSLDAQGLIHRDGQLQDLQDQVMQLTLRLEALDINFRLLSQHDERTRLYSKLGRPIGGAFIVLGCIFLVIGGARYLSVQHHLASSNSFPPARRTVIIASTSVGVLMTSAFIVIVAVALH